MAEFKLLFANLPMSFGLGQLLGNDGNFRKRSKLGEINFLFINILYRRTPTIG